MKVVRFLFGLCILADVAIGAVMIDWWIEEYREMGYFSDMYPSVTAICCAFLAIDIGSLVKLKKIGKKILITSAAMKVVVFSAVLSVDFFATGEKDAGIGWTIITALFIVIYAITYFAVMYAAKAKFTNASGNNIYLYDKFGGFKSEWLWEDVEAEYCEMHGISPDDIGDDDDDNDKIYYYCSVQIAYLFAWLAKRGFLNDTEFVNEIFDEVKNGSCDPAEFFYTSCDAALVRSDLRDEILPFMDFYCNDLANVYVKDYNELTGDGSEVKWCRDFSWEIYERFEKRIDERYEKFNINSEFENDYFEEFWARFDSESENLYSEIFGQDVCVYVSKDVAGEYAEKCKAHFQHLPESILRQLEDVFNNVLSQLINSESEAGYTAENIVKSFSGVELVIPKPYGEEPAFVICGRCEFDGVGGLAIALRGDRVLFVTSDYNIRTPWGYMDTGTSEEQ